MVNFVLGLVQEAYKKVMGERAELNVPAHLKSKL